jgi:hypothetical protein
MGVMAEIAAVWCLVLVMAFHAVCHGSGLFLGQNGPIRHRSMTNGALDAGLLMMHLMREIHESRKFVDPDPRNRFPLASESFQSLDRGAVLLDRTMAAHAECRARKSRQISGSGDGVAAQAGQSCRRVRLVVEGYRLCGRCFWRQRRRRGRLRPGRGGQHAKGPSEQCPYHHAGRANATKSPGLYSPGWLVSVESWLLLTGTTTNCFPFTM